jgi:Uma2 family endonuclease
VIVVPAPNLPDLAVEVLSAATEKRDRGRKMELLGRYGLPEYWLIDPGGRSLEAHVSGTTSRLEPARAVAGDKWFVSPTLAGLTFAVARVFERPA